MGGESIGGGLRRNIGDGGGWRDKNIQPKLRCKTCGRVFEGRAAKRKVIECIKAHKKKAES